MIRCVAFAVAASALALSACTPITTYSGFQAVEANPAEVKVGEDSKSTVLERLGTPSATAPMDTNTWFYVTQISDAVTFRKPVVRRRDVVAIAFNKDDEKVASVNTYGLKDGKVIDYSDRRTPTRGRELSVIEQMLGTIGQGGMLPQEDINPGSNRPR